MDDDDVHPVLRIGNSPGRTTVAIGDPISCGCGCAILALMSAVGISIALIGFGAAWWMVIRAYHVFF